MVLEDDPAVDDSGRLIEMEVDYWDVCDEKIPYFKKLAADGKIHEALDGLLALEKQTRTVRLSCLISCLRSCKHHLM